MHDVYATDPLLIHPGLILHDLRASPLSKSSMDRGWAAAGGGGGGGMVLFKES